jgi:hypothetical protein
MMFTGLLLIKLAAIIILLIIISYLLFRRVRSKSKTEEHLKHNIGLLRSEKLLIHNDKKSQKKRQQLLKKTKISEGVTQKQLMSKSKKLKMPAGEILLAEKILMCSK